MLFEHFPWLRRYFRKGRLWSPGKFFRSVGAVTDEAIKWYIAESNRGARQQQFLERYSAFQGGEVHLNNVLVNSPARTFVTITPNDHTNKFLVFEH